MDRISTITGIPEANSENLQMLRYGPNEFYKTHNDYIPYQKYRQAGVRIATFYIYLNDVEEGGTFVHWTGSTPHARAPNLNSNCFLHVLFSHEQARPTFRATTTCP
jgi:2OG-Fe(II) oxygenase superfamily